MATTIGDTNVICVNGFSRRFVPLWHRQLEHVGEKLWYRLLSAVSWEIKRDGWRHLASTKAMFLQTQQCCIHYLSLRSLTNSFEALVLFNGAILGWKRTNRFLPVVLRRRRVCIQDACEQSWYTVEGGKAGLWTLLSWVSRTHQNTLQFSWSTFWGKPFRKVDYSGSSLLLNPLLISPFPTSFFSHLFFKQHSHPPTPIDCLSEPHDLQFSSWNVSRPLPPVLPLLWVLVPL